MENGYREYEVGMSWDSYEGSLFRETRTTWPYAASREEAEQRAISQFGNNKGFRIEYIN